MIKCEHNWQLIALTSDYIMRYLYKELLSANLAECVSVNGTWLFINTIHAALWYHG